MSVTPTLPPIRALVVDDSGFMRIALRKIIEAEGDLQVVGEARTAGRRHVEHVLGALAAEASPDRPLCVVSSGETTVHVRGAGRGGRNQECALAMACAIDAAGADVLVAGEAGAGLAGAAAIGRAEAEGAGAAAWAGATAGAAR